MDIICYLSDVYSYSLRLCHRFDKKRSEIISYRLGDNDAIVKYYLCSVLPPPCCRYTLCNVNVITRVLPCLLTASLGTTKITRKHMFSINQLYRTHIITMLSIPTRWRHNAITVNVVKVLTSPHPVYRLQINLQLC